MMMITLMVMFFKMIKVHMMNMIMAITMKIITMVMMSPLLLLKFFKGNSELPVSVCNRIFR